MVVAYLNLLYRASTEVSLVSRYNVYDCVMAFTFKNIRSFKNCKHFAFNINPKRNFGDKPNRWRTFTDTSGSKYKLGLIVFAGSASAIYMKWKLSSSQISYGDKLYSYNHRQNDQAHGSSNLSEFFGNFFPKVEALINSSKRPNEDHVLKGLKLNHRERRFMKFASVEHQGQLYMTPQDFIESVTDSEPRPRLKRRVVHENDLERFGSETPNLAKGSPHMFRTIYDKGVISYTEYLFLLSILTKPQTGFRIAFNMFDTDGNERVDKEEFLVLEKIFSTARKDRLSRAMEGVTKTSPSKTDEDIEEVEDELQKCHTVDTMLLVHFFGKKGKQDLKFEEFKTFMENLQTEVLEIEFNEFSKGLPTISELDFAKILLRYTYLGSDQYEMYLERLLDRLPEEIGITFAEFKSFCQFLNTLDDFSIAMKMYTLADQPISQDEFHRAVKICTGQELSDHIVDTVFKIFDDDGDGQLSYKEFIAIMRNRLHRGFKTTIHGYLFSLCLLIHFDF
ncbi:Calcium uptake protein 3, mitochondrial [Armadillidium nasatum]|uniref:Calcium uptake protein 3, mitochondrial n=1 Tax=Armadillidium nasatum TaxID=96803 RepID=A0A5N5SZK6_9CRUS|nr:Calcium uptake protein 3, mitochondrial [Armadillidium nasatum]